jgi:exodeoxyribonuclease VII small subunit
VSRSRQMTYSQASTELEKIVGEMESEKIDVDALAEKVKRAAYLIRFCRTKLRSVEEEVKKAVAEMEEEEDGGIEEETDSY